MVSIIGFFIIIVIILINHWMSIHNRVFQPMILGTAPARKSPKTRWSYWCSCFTTGIQAQGRTQYIPLDITCYFWIKGTCHRILGNTFSSAKHKRSLPFFNSGRLTLLSCLARSAEKVWKMTGRSLPSKTWMYLFGWFHPEMKSAPQSSFCLWIMKSTSGILLLIGTYPAPVEMENILLFHRVLYKTNG